jgi:replication-associated recombination protein RarA
VGVVSGLIRLRARCSVLLHGTPNSGKTEFAKAVAAACGKAAYFVAAGAEGKARERLTAISAATSAFSPRESVVVVDEAGAILNTRYAFLGAGT